MVTVLFKKNINAMKTKKQNNRDLKRIISFVKKGERKIQKRTKRKEREKSSLFLLLNSFFSLFVCRKHHIPLPSSGWWAPFLSMPSCAKTAAEDSGGRLIPLSESASSRSCRRWLFSWVRMFTSRLRLTIKASRGS